MEIGAVVPHNEIGTDPGAIRAYAQGLEALGITHLLIYDHVMGADRDRPGGFQGPYDKDVAFHEPFTFFSFVAAVTERLDLVTAVLISPQRQTVLIAKQSAELAVLSGERFRLGIGTGWNTVEYQALNEEFTNRGRRQEEQVHLLRRRVPHRRAGEHPAPAVTPGADLVRRLGPGAARAVRSARRRVDPARFPERVVAGAARRHPRPP
jgi:alkanesulfonate monooxygenase SsuD/methylene tetrahydromethanopterin reductase-like flavin-dependent oxidoreductase (luciferase family)